MAKPPKIKKEKLQDDDFNFDTGLDFDDLDFDFNEPKKDRNPVDDFKSGFLDGLKDGPRDTTFIKDTFKEILPRGYGETIDFASNISSKVSQTYDETLRAIKPEIKNIKKSLSRTIPHDHALVPAKLGDLLKRWKDEGDREEELSSTTSPEGQRESFLSTQMAEIFANQSKQSQYDASVQDSKDAIAQGLELKQHRDSITVLSDIAASSARLDQYNRSVTLGFQKKSLEVAYRQLFGIQDLVRLAESQLRLSSDTLPNIQKNTGLPDFVKQHTTEFLAEYNKRRIAESIGTRLFGSGAEYVNKILENAKEKIQSTVKEGMAGLSDAASQVQDMSEMMGSTGVSAAGMAGSQAGEFVSKGLAKAGIKGLSDKLVHGNKSAVRLGLKGLNFVQNAGELAGKFRDKNIYNYEPGILNTLKRTAAEIMPSRRSTVSVSETASNPAGTGVVNEDGKLVADRTQRSITEIIPGYLARMLRELQATRTGDDSVELTTYDFLRSEFISKSKMGRRVKERVYDTKSAQDLHTSLDAILAKLETQGVKLSTEAKDSLKHRMTHNAANGKYADEESLGDESLYEKKEGSREAADAMKEYFTKGKIGDLIEFRSRHNRLASDLKGTAGNIQKLVDQGHVDLLREQGIVSSEVDQFTGKLSTDIDTKRMLDEYLSMKSSTATPTTAEIPKPSLVDAIKDTKFFQEAKQKTEDVTRSARAMGKKAKKSAFSQAKKMARKMGGKATEQTLTDENASAGDVLKATLSDLSSSTAGKGAQESMDKAVKKFDELAASNIHVSSAVDAAKEMGNTISSKVNNAQQQAKSLLERSMVDGEIDYEVLAKEIAKMPAQIRAAVVLWISKIKEDFIKSWNESKDKPTEPAKEGESVREEKDAPTMGGDASSPDPKPDEPKKFAKGGLFINRIISKATKFKLFGKKGVEQAVAGEAGEEAVMPVSKGGVQLIGHDGEKKSLLPVVRDRGGSLSVLDEPIKISASQPSMEMPGRAKSKKFNKEAEDIDYRERSVDGEDYARIKDDVKGSFKGIADILKSYVTKAQRAGVQAYDSVTAKAKQYKEQYEDKKKSKLLDENSTPQSSTLDEGIAQVNDTLRKILERLNSMDGVGGGGTPGSSDKAKGGLFSRAMSLLGDSVVAGGSAAASGLWGLTKGSAKLSGKILNFQFGAAKVAGDFLFSKKDLVRDVYVQGEDAPRLYAAGIKQGIYTRKVTQDQLRSHRDVDQPILDKDGNVVISDEDLKKLVVYDDSGRFVSLVTKLASGAWSLGKSAASKAFAFSKMGLSLEMNIIRGAASIAKKAVGAGYDFLGRPVDIYSPGMPEPVLLASLMSKGYYRSKTTGAVIKTYNDIDGPIVDPEGNEVVSYEIIRKGLVDAKGRPLRGRLGRLLGAGASVIKGVAKGIYRTQKMAWKATVGISKAMLSGAKSVLGGAGRFLTGGLNGVMGTSGSGSFASGDYQTKLLEEIRDILANQFGSPLKREDSSDSNNSASAGSAVDSVKAAAAGVTSNIKGKAKSIFAKASELYSGAKSKVNDKLRKVHPTKTPKEDLGDNITPVKQILPRVMAPWVPRLPAPEMLRLAAPRSTNLAYPKASELPLLPRQPLATQTPLLEAPASASREVKPSEPVKKKRSLSGLLGLGKSKFLSFIKSIKSRLFKGASKDQVIKVSDKDIEVLDDNKLQSTLKGLSASQVKKLQLELSKQTSLSAPNHQRIKESLTELYPKLLGGPSSSALAPYSMKDIAQSATSKQKYAAGKPKWNGEFEDVTARTVHVKGANKQSGEDAKARADAKLAKSGTPEGKGILEMLSGLKDIIGGVKGLFSLGKGGVGMLGKVGGWAAGLGGAASAATAATAATGAAAGTAAAGAAATTAATGAAAVGSTGLLATIGSAIAATAATLGSVITAPVALGILATAAAGYGAWKVYKHYRDKLYTVDKLRLVQYGFHPDDQDNYTRLLTLERVLQDRVVFTNEGPDILEGKVNLEEILGIFDLDPKDNKDVERFSLWYRNRFKSIFLTHVLAIKQVTGKFNMDKIAGLSPKQMKEYVRIASFTEGPYGYSQLPIKDLKYKATGADDVKSIISAIRLEYKLDTSGALEGKDPVGKKDSREMQGAKMVADAQAAQQKSLKESMPTLPKTSFNLDRETPPTATSATSAMDSKSNPDNLKLADGPKLDGRNGYRLIKQDGKLKMEQVNPALLRNFFGMVEEYYQLTGKRITVTDAYRSYEDQVRAKQKFGDKAATPGNSPHGFGLAIDADSKALGEMEDLGLMRKYGLTRPVGGEPWHVEPVGVQLDFDRYKLQPELASKAIDEGAGRGGSGAGSVNGSVMGSRDLSLIKKVLTANVSPNVKMQGIKSDLSPMGSDQKLPTIANRPTSPLQSAAKSFTQDSTGTLPKAANQPKFSHPVAGGDIEKPPSTSGAVEFSKKPSFGPLPSSGDIGKVSSIPDPKPGDRESMKDTITAAARVVGVDPNVALTTAAIESGMNPSAKSRVGSAAGLNGFTQATWKETVTKHGAKYGYTPSTTSVFDAKANAIMGAHLIKDNALDSDPVKAYMAHFLGKGGSNKLYKAQQETPQASAADVLPKAASYNQPIFYENGSPRSVQGLIDFITAKVHKVASSFGINLGNTAPVQTATRRAAPASEDSTGVAQTIKTAYAPSRNSPRKPLEATRRSDIPARDTSVATAPIEAPIAPNRSSYPGMDSGIDLQQVRTSPYRVVDDNTPGANLMLKTETILAESLVTQRQMVELLRVIATQKPAEKTTPAKDKEVTPSAPSAAVESPSLERVMPKSAMARYDLPKVPVSMRRTA